MAERNMIKEGFVTNTLDSLGAISGTQVATIPQINALVDEDIVSSALTVSGGELVALDADLGSRWKLTRLEYHTDEIDIANFSMNISDNNEDFFPVTLTGNAPLYIGDISETTVSGAPRYIRLEHSPVESGAEALEWRAINDDALVNFGDTGTQTEINIVDSPIGKPSDTVQPLSLFNNFTKNANGFIFIENTGDSGDDNIEVAISPTGPWLGRNTNNTLQPDTTLFNEGRFSNTRVVSGTGFSQDFSNGSTNEWTGIDISGITNTGQFLSGTTTDTSPSLVLDPGYGNNFNSNYPTFRTDGFDRVAITLKIPSLNLDDFTEGPRLFWKNTSNGFSTPGVSTEILSTVPSGNFTGLEQTFTFNVGSMVTWSGVNVAFKVQLYTATSGTAIPIEMHNFEVYHSSRKERVSLDFQPVTSGEQTLDLIHPINSTLEVFDNPASQITSLTVISFWHRILSPCVITKLYVNARPGDGQSGDQTGFFLARINEGSPFPSPGSNFNVKRVVQMQEAHAVGTNSILVPDGATCFMEVPVHWPAEPGDFIGWSDEGYSVASFRSTSSRIKYRAVPDSLASITISGNGNEVRLDSTSNCQTDLNGFDLASGTDGDFKPRAYAIFFDATSAGDYFSSGNYETPIFDGGSATSLLTASFESETFNSTSIDVSGNAAFDTIDAKASAIPPRTSLEFGDFNGTFYRLNKDTPDSEITTFSINSANSTVTAREGATPIGGSGGERDITNLGVSMLYHETKDELWVLNNLVSGTVTNDVSPTWDRFEVASGNFIGTQSLGGTPFFAYTHPASSEAYSFEPMGFVADYTRGEIYIIQRENAFFIGSSSYYGIRMDLEGNFLDVILKSEDMGLDTSPSTVNEDARFNNCIDVAYDGTYFYFLTNDSTANLEDFGQNIMIIKPNNNGVDFNDMQFKTYISIDSIPGLSFAGNDETSARCLAYNSTDGNFYLAFHNTSGSDSISNRNINLIGIGLTPDSNDVFTTSFVKSVENSELSPTLPGFVNESNTLDSTQNNYDWSGVLLRKIDYFTDMVYIPKRDTFGILQTLRADRTSDFLEDGSFSLDIYLFWRENFSFFLEAAAGLKDPVIELPDLGVDTDPFWGVNSGTLSYQQIQDDSVLFPTGRYAQMKYTLNSNSGNINTPYLISSKLAQGLRVDDIPAQGTKTIYLRTNIPEGTSVTDQSGRLKVFWELEE